MPITNFLNLAEIYRNADQGRAAQQNATLRDLQIGQAQAAEQERQGLAGITRSMIGPTGELDYRKGAELAGQAGYLAPAMKFAEAGAERETKKLETEKNKTNLMGQLVAIPDAPPEQRQGLYENALAEIEKVDPKAAALMRQEDPVYNDITDKKLQQLRLRTITPYQSEVLKNQKLRASGLGGGAGAATLRLRLSELNRMRESGDIDDDEYLAETRRVLGTLQKEGGGRAAPVVAPVSSTQRFNTIDVIKADPVFSKLSEEDRASAAEAISARANALMAEDRAGGDPNNRMDVGVATDQAMEELRQKMTPGVPGSFFKRGSPFFDQPPKFNRPGAPGLPLPTLGANAGPKPVRSQAEFDALSRGAKYLGSDGQVRTKP